MSLNLNRFKNPPAELRGAPFWSLNTDLTDHQRLRDQIDALAEMGMGGYHLHVRAGLKTPYLSKDFLDAIHAARDHGASKDMLSYLYDEDTWPSGFAGGAVTQHLKHRVNHVSLRKGRPEEAPSDFSQPLYAYRVELDSKGRLIDAKRLPWDEGDDDDWYLSHEIARDNDRFNGASYVDAMSPDAIRAFIDSTHEVYLKSFDGKFPKDVPAIFTDEPHFGSHQPLTKPDAGVTNLPWTSDLRESFRADWDTELLDILPWIVWPTPDGASAWRWRYWDHLSERFAVAFNDQLGQWCEEHGIALTGHMLNEDYLNGQVGSVGDCMRQYRAYQIPGIDLLCDEYRPATAKQCVSVARQNGRSQVMSELYGVTNWDFPFSGHKVQGDWQAALGINLRVPHLTWISMEGASKRDYPASIGPQSPWYREYPLIEDHFARVGAALSEGKALVRIGLIHPIGNAWLHRGVRSLDDPRSQRHERMYHETIDTLLNAGLDFDFICEALLPKQERDTHDAVLQVGEMAYEVVVLPKLEVLRQSTLDSLQQFMARGGTVIVVGSSPSRVDGEPSDTPGKILCNAKHIDTDPLTLVEALEPWRELAVLNQSGHHVSTVNHQIRQVGEERIVFCSNRQKALEYKTPWQPSAGDAEIRLRGYWQVRELDTVTGEENDCAYHQADGWTTVTWACHPQSHRLLRLTPGEGEHNEPQPSWTVIRDLNEPTQVNREEPNSLLLDIAEWRVSGEDWQPAEDSIMAQMKLARRFNWPDWSQPYSVKDAGPKQRVDRRYTILCDAELTDLQLVCERMKEARFMLDGQPLDAQPTGWWVDRDLPTAPLPILSAGKHTLEISMELDAVNRYLEWCYLLGDFQVTTRGAHARLVPESPIYWGDITRQGLPFYGGNLDYECVIHIEKPGHYALRCPDFGGALLRVWCNDEDRGPIAFAPNRAELGQLPAGEHRVRIRCYGNRMNAFGALHNNHPEWAWWGPPAWRLENEHRNDVWQLRPTGLLRAPLLEKLD